jgi:hypothetical protein
MIEVDERVIGPIEQKFCAVQESERVLGRVDTCASSIKQLKLPVIRMKGKNRHIV